MSRTLDPVQLPCVALDVPIMHYAAHVHAHNARIHDLLYVK